MTIEDEMRKEISRIKDEISLLDTELETLKNRIVQIMMNKRKLERDLNILLSYFEPLERRRGEFQTSLAQALR